MTCTPCRVTYQGTRYEVSKDGAVRPTRIIEEPDFDGCAQPTGTTYKTRIYDAPVDAETAKAVRQEAARQRRNRNTRTRHMAMRTLGMRKTPYGWE